MRDYDAVAKSFDPAFVTEVGVLQRETQLLRVYGASISPHRALLFCCLLRPEIRSGEPPGPRKLVPFWSDASGLATPPENLRDHLAVVTIPAGTTALIGTVADNFHNAAGKPVPGGNAQIFIPHLATFPFERYKLAQFGAMTEIEIQSDDRILRFRK